jgi:hypothetical protein
VNEQLVKPEPSVEVAKFLELWSNYKAAIDACKFENLSSWGRDYNLIIDSNQAIAERNSLAMVAVVAIGEEIADLGGLVADEAQQYQGALYEYNQAMREEKERPQREWEQAKRAYESMLEKEQRSLKIKIGRMSNKRWSVSEPERQLLDAQIELMDARLSVVEITLSNVSWMRYYDFEGTEFSEDLVVEATTRNRERINELIAKLDAKRLQEADA